MKGFVLRVLFSFLIGTTSIFLIFSTKEKTSSVPDMALTRDDNGMMTATSRRLKEKGYTSSTDNSAAGSVNLDDYRPIDPVPSSKNSIRPGPIQHGTPIRPYIPRPSPPGNPKRGGIP
ncbi:uncharacterized protein LOC132274010 isoform X2 [Cornus florida]|uniref:uncharacterized protein LOC132274010 isoform X2 n=1 Tax=Cornus florida TaxID=4283 RepID=UPI002899D307|nr:uncharacterized protein LOC132274010 isoform X2 [Cornus florida]